LETAKDEFLRQRENNMSNYTPGPWRFNNNVQWGWVTNPFSVTVKKPGVHSAVVANMPARQTIPWTEAEANARLIAAAPDLLEALQRLITEIEVATAARTLGELGAIGQAEAAIRRATGDKNEHQD